MCFLYSLLIFVYFPFYRRNYFILIYQKKIVPNLNATEKNDNKAKVLLYDTINKTGNVLTNLLSSSGLTQNINQINDNFNSINVQTLTSLFNDINKTAIILTYFFILYRKKYVKE